MLKNTLQRIVKPEVLNENSQLHKIDLSKEENLLPAKEVDLVFVTRHALRSTSNVSDKQVLLFRKECKKCLKTFATKLLLRSPLKFPLTKHLSFLNPELARADEDCCHNELMSCLDTFMEKKNNIRAYSRNHYASIQDCLFNTSCQRSNQIFQTKWNDIRYILDDDFGEQPYKCNWLKELYQVSSHYFSWQCKCRKRIFFEQGVYCRKSTWIIAQRHVIEAINSAGGELKMCQLQSRASMHLKMHIQDTKNQYRNRKKMMR